MQNDNIIRKLRELSEMNVGGYTEENVKYRVVIRILEILGHRDALDMEHRYGTDKPVL